MRIVTSILAACVFLGLFGFPSAALAEEGINVPEECTFEEGEMGSYIVGFHDWVVDPKAVAREQVERYGGILGFVYTYALKGYSAEYFPASAEVLQTEPTVEYVEVDQLLWIDETSGIEQWGSCPLAPPLGPGKPEFPEEPEEPTEEPGEPEAPEQSEPEEPDMSGHAAETEVPGLTDVAPSDVGSSSPPRQTVPAVQPAIRSRSGHCRPPKTKKGKRCIPRWSHRTRICGQRAVSVMRRC